MHAAEERARALLEKVAVDLVGAEQRDAALPVGTLRLESVQLFRDRVGLDLELALGLKPAAAVLGVMDEVADDERRDPVKRQRDQDFTHAPADNHPGRLG